MGKKHIFLVLSILFIISSCQNKGLGDNELPDFGNAENLLLVDSIEIEKLGILNPQMIRFSDDFLVFHSSQGLREFHFLDLRSMTVTEKIVTGQGPNEVSDYDLILGNDKKTVNYIDNQKWDVYSFNLDSIRANPAVKQQWIYQIPKKKGVAFMQIPIETGRYIFFTGVYTSGDKWIYCYDKQTQEFSSYADFPDYEGARNLELMTKSMLFGLVTKATNGKRLVLTRWGTVDFFDIMPDGGLKVFREHHYFLPEIELYPNGTFRYKGEAINWGFSFFISSDEKYIYLLYSDKIIYDNLDQNFEYLFVYDWSGNSVKQYSLEKPLYNITVNGDKLYGLSREEEPIVYIYSLEDLLRK